MPSFAVGKELAGLGGVFNRFVAAPAAGFALFNQGRSGSTLEKALQSIPSTKNTDAGRAAWNELQYMGSQIMQRRLPYTAPAQQAQQTGMYGRYASPSAQVSTPSASPSPAAERAYQQEASRVAQLTAQDPELQRYEAARAGAKTQEEMNAARDIGMQMWAKANPGLAAKVKPGQSGYEAIQGTLAGNAARAGQGFGMQEQLVPTPQGFPTSVPGLPEGAGFGAGFNIPQALMQTPAIPFGTQQAAQTPATSAAQSAFGQPSVLDTTDFERLLQQLKK